MPSDPMYGVSALQSVYDHLKQLKENNPTLFKALEDMASYNPCRDVGNMLFEEGLYDLRHAYNNLPSPIWR